MCLLIIPLFITAHWLDIVDILLVALMFYQFYRLVKGTAAINVFFGIFTIYLIWQVVKLLQMDLLGEILGQFVSVGILGLIIVFQKEIRQFLLLLGSPRFFGMKSKSFLFWKLNLGSVHHLDIDPIITACQKLSVNKTGALIVLARENELRQFTETGEMIDSRISEQLLENIFFKNSPLHDGAVIIRFNRIVAARCILPVSGSKKIPFNFGLRHRSAVGITEQSDCVSLIVSEESSKIAYCRNGKLHPEILPAQLKTFLEEEFNQ